MVVRIGRGCWGWSPTGLAVEFALIPFALFHFHRAGLYGVGANIIAIPLTTFVIMPLEAGALLLDTVGLGPAVVVLCGAAIGGLLSPRACGRGRARRRGAAALDAAVGVRRDGRGGAVAVPVDHAHAAARPAPRRGRRARRGAAPTPDLLITGDGRHLAVVERRHAVDPARAGRRLCPPDCSPKPRGSTAIRRISASRPYSACSRDACVAMIRKGRAEWRLLATRSATRIDWASSRAPAPTADIVVSDRRLPRGCTPRWLKLDRPALRRTGGLAIYLGRRAARRHGRRSGRGAPVGAGTV